MPKKILIAEDEPSLSRVLTKKLKGLGYDTVQATDGQEVIEKITSEKPDLVLLDIIMPRKNGLEVLQELRVKLGDQLPVVILSNLEQPADQEAGKRYGANNYLIKSNISLGQLAAVISSALA